MFFRGYRSKTPWMVEQGTWNVDCIMACGLQIMDCGLDNCVHECPILELGSRY